MSYNPVPLPCVYSATDGVAPFDSLGDSEQRFKDIDKEFDSAREQAKQAKDAFNVIKKKRCDLFNKAFRHIEDRIDQVYKDLTKGKASPQGGIAYLSLEEPEVCSTWIRGRPRCSFCAGVVVRNLTCTVSSTTRCLRSNGSATWSNSREEKRRWLRLLFSLRSTRERVSGCWRVRAVVLIEYRSLRRFHPSPFFVLDEVDGALGQ